MAIENEPVGVSILFSVLGSLEIAFPVFVVFSSGKLRDSFSGFCSAVSINS